MDLQTLLHVQRLARAVMTELKLFFFFLNIDRLTDQCRHKMPNHHRNRRATEKGPCE